MKKNLIIGILCIVSALSSVFAVAQRFEAIAIESTAKAEKMMRLAEMARTEADQQRMLAAVSAGEARKQAQMALDQSQFAKAKKSTH